MVAGWETISSKENQQKQMSKTAVIIGRVFPEATSTAASWRMIQLLELLQAEGYTLHFLSAAEPSKYASDLSKWVAQQKFISVNDDRFDNLLAEINPSLVLFDRFITEEQFGWRVSEVCPNAIKILDTEDLHFLRKAREDVFKANGEQLHLQNELFKREIASILRCDLSLIISGFEYELLVNEFQIDRQVLFYLPFLYDDENVKKTSFYDRNHFVSIGNFLHEPNWYTVLALKRMWPNIRKQLPKAELHIYGAYLPEKAKQLHQPKNGFIIKGKAKDVVSTFLNYRLLLAPIPYGAGLKGKIFEAMRCGLPTISSSIGVEGFTNEQNEFGGYIADSDDLFTTYVVDLFSNEKDWIEKQQKGMQLLQSNFHRSLFVNKWKKQIQFLENHLEKHRKNQFLFGVMNYQSNQATKYMSKWITLKNKSF